MGKIKIYDTTLRDGMQAEGVSFSLEDKLAIARCLDELGLDYIEGGYAASNPKEMQFFEEAAKLGLKNSAITAFGSTRRAGLEVIFDAEHFYDGYRENPEYTMKVLAAAAEAGADALVLCDTNGGSMPEQVYKITRAVCERFSPTLVGIHTHNDTDCATANSLAAVRAGARHVQGTINGLGERCGNANLCTVIPSLAFKMGSDVLSPEKVKTITEVSRFVFEVGNLTPMMNMPYVGESAFAHKGGLHVDALRKSKRSYEHISPELVGNERRFLISELSGKSTVLAELEKAKIAEDKKLARKILKRMMGTYRTFFELIKYHIDVEKRATGDIVTEATVKLKVGDRTEHVVGEGDGPVNALDGALRKSLENFYPCIKDVHLIDYKVRVVNAKAGTAARVRVIIESMDKNSMWGTVGVSENIIEASWQALVDSVEYKLHKDST
jgi:2-isopropylmalate synthase